MKYPTTGAGLVLGLVSLPFAVAQSSIVTGTCPGFANGVTGGGDATPVYPKTVDELKTYLTSSEPQNIVISDEFNFVGSEGTKTYAACDSYSCTPSNGGQAMLNTLNGCTTSTYDVTIDVAGYQGINVASDKTLVGKGTGAILNGKGLRFVDVSNIIIQNIAITNLNPKYVWGGDAFTLSGTSKIWIDHVTTSNTGRQHYSFGQDSSKEITISNSYLNGKTSHSASCDEHTYWAMELVGSADSITFYQNYVYFTSGRTPALSGTTLFHAVNNVWEDNSGHLIEGTSSGKGLYEGNVFINDATVVQSGFVGKLFNADSSNASQCQTYLKRVCEANQFTNSGAFSYSDTDFFSEFSSLNVVGAAAASSIASTVPGSAGNTLSN